MIETWAGMHRVFIDFDIDHFDIELTPEEAKVLGERLIMLSELASKGGVVKRDS